MFQSVGRPADAEQEYRQALALEEKLVADEPANPDCRRDLAYSYFGFADFLRYNKRTSEVEDFDRRALGLFEKLGDEFPARDNDRLEVGQRCGAGRDELEFGPARRDRKVPSAVPGGV